MRWTFGRTALCLGAVVVMTAAGFAATQGPDLPEGEGKEILDVTCVGCHDLQDTLKTRMDKDGWYDLVGRMLLYGAQLREEQVNVLVDYLATNLGKAEEEAEGGEEAGAPAQPDESPQAEADLAAASLLETACKSCHDLELVTDSAYSEDKWYEVIENMMAKGVLLSNEEVDLLVEYLTRNHGPK